MMTYLTCLTHRWLHNTRGATAIEYGLIVAAIALVIVGFIMTIGGNLTTVFSAAATKVGSVL